MSKCIDNSTDYITVQQFEDIIKRHDNYVKTNKIEPNICYIDSIKKDTHITINKYYDMKTRYDNYIKEHCQKPNICYITKPTSTSTGTSINTNPEGKVFLLDNLISARQTFRKHVKNNNNYPNYLDIKGKDGKLYRCDKALYMGLFEAMHMFAIRNGRLPNWVEANTTANNPLVIDYQNNGYTCGPTSLSMCLQMFADYISEPTLAKYAGTTRNGTGPADLIRTAKHYGYNMTEIRRNSKAVQDSLNKCRPVLMHIHTSYAGGRSCLGYRGSYGHYIMCYKMKNGKYCIADPTKGFKVCAPSGIDNARSSSNMKYYSISIA